MRPMKRAIHVDFHTMPGIYDFNREWDAAEFAQILQDAHVDYVNAFARCNIGFAYYHTRIGVPYPGMKGDMFGDLLRECHKRNIGVSAYMNIGLDHEKAIKHPDWLRMDRDGRIIDMRKGGNFFRTMCHNNPDYREYVFGMLKELVAYDPDGYFFDCMGLRYCCCPHCVGEMRKRGLDPYDWVTNMRFQQQTYIEFSQIAHDIIGPDKYFQMNGLQYDVIDHIARHMEIECLPSAGGSWGYDYFWPCASYARNLYKTVIYMTGRFQVNWADFGGFKSKASLENDYYDALCAGVGVSIGDHQHPAKNLDKEIYKVVGQLNQMVLQLEPYTENASFLADIGVLVKKGYSEISAKEERWGGWLTDSYKGLARMFGELKLSYDIINEDMDLSKYKVLVLPDNFPITDEIEKKITEYVKRGGRLLVSGTAGLKEDRGGFIEPFNEFEYEGMDNRNHSYFRFTGINDPGIFDMDYCMYSNSGVLFTGGQVLARDVKGYFDEKWDGLHYYSYIPPEKSTRYAAAAVNASRTAGYISFQVFRAYCNYSPYSHKALVRQCMEMLLPDPLIKTRGIPSTARVTATGCSKYTLLHVKVTYPEIRGKTGIIEEHNTLEAGAEVSVRGIYRKAYTLPDKTPVEIVGVRDGYTSVRLPGITGYRMIYLEC